MQTSLLPFKFFNYIDWSVQTQVYHIVIIFYFENVHIFQAKLGLVICPYEVSPHIHEYCSFRLQTKHFHSSTPRYFSAHQITSGGTISNAKACSLEHFCHNKSSFLAMFFSCSCRTMKIASVMLLPAINQNCMPSIFTSFSLSLQSLFPKPS